jgi:quercetin dioxygenase-like cupin family protein
MKLPSRPSVASLAAFVSLCTMLSAQTPAPATPAPAAKLLSNVFDWEKMTVTPNAKGSRRAVFDGPTATVDKMHCHITTLNPGEKSGEPSKHLQEEVIVVKEGTVEAHWDGQSKTGGPGSVIFLAAGATTFLRNAGTTPCTYIVIYYYTPLTPKS